MRRAEDSNAERRSAGPRRRFLSAAAGMAAALAGCSQKPAKVQARDAASAASADTPRSAGAGPSSRSRVVVVRNAAALDADGRVNEAVVGDMLKTAMLKASGAASLADAWRAYVRPDDVVGIKVNCLGGPSLCTHPELAAHIAGGMQQAGVAPENIIIYDRLTSELEECGFAVGTRRGPQCYGSDAVGYDAEPTVVMSTGSCFSRIVSEQCTAIVNAPILKDHDGAGITCALKNHFGSINNPNKLHTDHCDPHVADINCAPFIRSKQRICIGDALLVCYEGGPGYKPETTVAYGAILVSADPVALDTVGLGLIEELRKKHGFEPLGKQERAPRYIATAADAEHRLGRNRLADIEVVDSTVAG